MTSTSAPSSSSEVRSVKRVRIEDPVASSSAPPPPLTTTTFAVISNLVVVTQGHRFIVDKNTLAANFHHMSDLLSTSEDDVKTLKLATNCSPDAVTDVLELVYKQLPPTRARAAAFLALFNHWRPSDTGLALLKRVLCDCLVSDATTKDRYLAATQLLVDIDSAFFCPRVARSVIARLVNKSFYPRDVRHDILADAFSLLLSAEIEIGCKKLTELTVTAGPIVHTVQKRIGSRIYELKKQVHGNPNWLLECVDQSFWY